MERRRFLELAGVGLGSSLVSPKLVAGIASRTPPMATLPSKGDAASAYGSGHFGKWITDSFGLPAYLYTCNQITDPKAVSPVDKAWRPPTDHTHQVGNGESSPKYLTVRDLLARIYARVASDIGVGTHGLMRLFNGDWNDSIVLNCLTPAQVAEVSQHGESVLNAAMAVYVLDYYARMLDFGIGRALSLGLAEAGADVVPSGRRKENIDEVASEIESRGRRTLRLTCDIGDRESLQQLANASREHFGKIDILVNCAAKITRTPTLDMPEKDWQDIIDTNLTGTFRACQVFGKHMLEQGSGRIINIASLNAFVALSEVAAYAASKAAVVSLTRSLAVEWSKKGVLVNAIAPAVFAQHLMRTSSTTPLEARSC